MQPNEHRRRADPYGLRLGRSRLTWIAVGAAMGVAMPVLGYLVAPILLG